jgi:hypothetical protein
MRTIAVVLSHHRLIANLRLIAVRLTFNHWLFGRLMRHMLGISLLHGIPVGVEASVLTFERTHRYFSLNLISPNSRLFEHPYFLLVLAI